MNSSRRVATAPTVQKILYRSLGGISLSGISLSLISLSLISLAALLSVMGALAVPSAAQESTPEIVPLEKKLRVIKKDLGPRALGLLRMTPSGKATLVPVMIEINGKFYDASAYKADPIPMALDSGTVYEGEKTGVSVGLFTVNSALHSLAANAEVPWLATGAWVAEGATAPKTAMKAETVPVGIETSDGPPRLSKSGTTGGTASSTAPTTVPTTGTTPPASPSTTTSTAPPATPTSPSAAPAPASANPPASPSSTPKSEEKSGEKKDEKTTEQKPSVEKEASAPSTQQSSGGTGDDTNRPRLRRGKPSGPMPDYGVPGYGKPKAAKDSSSSAAASSAVRPDAAAAPMEPVVLIPAISDANGPELRSFGYEWDQGAEEERHKQMLDLAKAQLHAYIDARAKGQIPAKPVAPHATARKTPARTGKVIEPILENVQMRTFDLWGSNQPVLLLSADAHMPPPPAGAADLPSAPLQYKILLVTRTDIYGNLHKLYSGVTDRFHLDVIPQLDLIDAVDADGDGRGELLFHKTTDTATGYVIYRATSDTLWKMFDTVNPQ